ncbi:MAG: glycosyltransferase family 4 protein [Eubacteriaceae bacterium]|nr:glycosyltransferase family 4 protein [Eubacteriaceae bacterium]
MKGKQQRKLFYLGNYRTEAVADRYPLGSSAQDNKMAYLVSVFKRCIDHVTVVSVLSSEKPGYYKTLRVKVDDGEDDVFLASYDTSARGISKIAALYRLIVLTFYLITHVTKDDVLIVYHNPLFSLPVRLAKKLKRFQFILEVEEIFSRDKRNSKDIKRRGIEMKLINAAQKYICAGDLLLKEVSRGKNNPHTSFGAVVYGGYSIPPKLTERFDDGFIHIVYAGGIDSLRCVNNVVDSMEYLPMNYKLHILGFGSPGDIKALEDCIEKVNSAAGEIRAEFLGELHGDSYNMFLQKCHIGINAQKIGESIEEYAFPSKITSYLGCGLNVVSGRLKSIENSALNKYMNYFDTNSPRDIALAISSCGINSYEQQILINKHLDEQLYTKINEMLEYEK